MNAADQLCWTAATSGSCAAPPTGATTYSYDNRGNRIRITPPSGGSTTLAYDQANRLTAYGSLATYAYNGDGLRMSKVVSGTTSQFVWDVASSLQLLIKDGSTVYIYGPDGSALEQIFGSAVRWLHHDQLGNTRLVTDSSGTSQSTYTYDAYGNLVASTGSIANPLRFAGEYQDTESGLYYLRARYYDSATDEFITQDPALPRSRQPYTYGRGSPVNLSDPSGLLGEGLALCLTAEVPVAGEVACGIGIGETLVQGATLVVGAWVLTHPPTMTQVQSSVKANTATCSEESVQVDDLLLFSKGESRYIRYLEGKYGLDAGSLGAYVEENKSEGRRGTRNSKGDFTNPELEGLARELAGR